ncbi:sulfur carrier protein ThiS [Pseudonocardia acaciae]|uniref:sulfur carrier protein ThiS n=1 Tax=Pseudonocardia acaciae TaxID=551276 RepID=UPI00048A63BA|nr:sulfur carrier protein ThiS [Pseudonocardia acaciae]
MRVWINGDPHDVPEPATVADALAAMGAPAAGVAVAVDGEVVPRAGWSERRLAAEARIEVLTAVQGG